MIILGALDARSVAVDLNAQGLYQGQVWWCMYHAPAPDKGRMSLGHDESSGARAAPLVYAGECCSRTGNSTSASPGMRRRCGASCATWRCSRTAAFPPPPATCSRRARSSRSACQVNTAAAAAVILPAAAAGGAATHFPTTAHLHLVCCAREPPQPQKGSTQLPSLPAAVVQLCQPWFCRGNGEASGMAASRLLTA